MYASVFPMPHTLSPVSYTHLDVYKRQGLVRKAQNRYHQKGQSVDEISQVLGISFRAAARAIAYPTHFFSVYDLQDPDDDGDIFVRFTTNRLSGSAEDAVIRMLTMECLREAVSYTHLSLRVMRLSSVRSTPW